MITQHDFLPAEVESVFPAPDLPAALQKYDPGEILADVECSIIAAVIAKADITHEFLVSMMPTPRDVVPRKFRFNDATKIVIARIHACLPHGYKQRYLAVGGISHQCMPVWLRMPYLPVDDMGNDQMYAHVVAVLDALPRPIPRNMLTHDVKRALVIGYKVTGNGRKEAFLQRYGIGRQAIASWQVAMADGDLDNDLVPRKIGAMTNEDLREIVNLRKQVSKLRQENDQLKETNAALTQSLRSDYVPAEKLEQLEKVVDALGKAITTMPNDGAD